VTALDDAWTMYYMLHRLKDSEAIYREAVEVRHRIVTANPLYGDILAQSLLSRARSLESPGSSLVCLLAHESANISYSSSSKDAAQFMLNKCQSAATFAGDQLY